MNENEGRPNQPIISQLATRTGAANIRMAQDLARSAGRSKVQIKTRIINGYIIRGIKRGKISLAQVVDPPSFALLAGRVNVGPMLGVNLGMEVGNRDEVYPPGTKAAYQGKESVGDTSISRTAWVSLASAGGDVGREVINRSPIQISTGLMSDGQLSAGIATEWNSYQNLDDLTKFTDASPVTISGAIRTQLLSSFPVSVVDGSVVSGQIPDSYFAHHSFTVAESQLPAGWRFFPRRLLPWQGYTHTTIDDLQVVSYDEPYNFGFCAAPTANTDPAKIDKFCLAAGCDNQPKVLFREADGGEVCYARFGEKGLAIAIGSLDRSSFKGEDLEAALDNLKVFTTNDLDIALRPFPINRLEANAFGRPAIKALSYWRFPLPLRATEGFVTFCHYQANQVPSGSARLFKIMGIVVALADNSLVSAKMDWYDPGANLAEAPPIPGFDPGYFAYPYIVGGVSVAGSDNYGKPTLTAQCVVWEYMAGRRTEDPAAGVQWVVYVTQGAKPDRVVLTGDACGPLFGQLMASPPWVGEGIPTGFTAQPWSWFYPGNIVYRIDSGHGVYRPDTEHQWSAVYDCGGGRLVTAAIVYPWPEAQIFGGVNTNLQVATHDIRCATIDLNTTTTGTTGHITLRGTIAARTNATSKCIITVAQPYLPASKGRPAVEAVLIASVVEHIHSTLGSGATYLSMDGGDTWREYLTDIGGQAGTFWAGNSLYLFDPLKPFIEASL